MNQKRRSLLEWERDAIVAAMAANEKRESICEEFGVSRSYPTTLARRRGLEPRSAGRPKRSQLVELKLCKSVQLPSRAAMVPAVSREDREEQHSAGTIAR